MNKEIGETYYWSLSKFQSRYYIIKELLDQYFGTNTLPNLCQDEDPFWDPLEPTLVGQGFYKLASLTFLFDDPTEIPLVGDFQGASLHVKFAYFCYFYSFLKQGQRHSDRRFGWAKPSWRTRKKWRNRFCLRRAQRPNREKTRFHYQNWVRCSSRKPLQGSLRRILYFRGREEHGLLPNRAGSLISIQ